MSYSEDITKYESVDGKKITQTALQVGRLLDGLSVDEAYEVLDRVKGHITSNAYFKAD